MTAPLYRSQTRSVPIADLPATVRNALLTHADTKKLRLVSTRAWLTQRENPASETMFGKLFGKRSNSADPDAAHDMVLLLHATHLLVGTSGAVRGTTILSLPLLSATVTRGSLLAGRLQRPNQDLPSDDGLTISGFPGDHGNSGTYFMGLGAGADADACVQAVMAAVEAAKNPALPAPG
jgi:hypothetical protein